MEEYLRLFIANMIVSIPNALTALAIFLASLYLARVIANVLKRVLQGRRAPANATRLLTQSARWTIIVIGTITALQRFFDVAAFLTGLGILSFTVGFALQDVMKNFAAGVILLLQRPFRSGEAISVAGFEGNILAVDLRTTEMRTFDGRIVIIPNAIIITNPITNYTRAERRRVEVNLGVSFGSDLQAVRQLVFEILEEVKGVVSEPAPQVVFQSFSDVSAGLTAYFWIDTTKTTPAEAKDAVLTRVKAAFDQAEIEFR